MLVGRKAKGFKTFQKIQKNQTKQHNSKIINANQLKPKTDHSKNNRNQRKSWKSMTTNENIIEIKESNEILLKSIKT